MAKDKGRDVSAAAGRGMSAAPGVIEFIRTTDFLFKWRQLGVRDAGPSTYNQSCYQRASRLTG